MARKITAIFFDHGGTLFDYDPPNAVVWANIAERLGVTIAPDDPRILQGLRSQLREFDKIDKDVRELSDAEWHRLNCVVLETMGVEGEGSFEIVNAEFRAREHGKLFQIFPDVVDTLRQIKQRGLKIGLISNIDEELALKRRQSLQQQGIQRFFDAIILSAEVGAWKPDKEIFEIALREIGISNPAEAMHVGDSLRLDVRGARNAGLIPVLFDPLDLRAVDDVIKIKALSEVLQYLD